MNGYSFSLAGVPLVALPSGAIWWAAQRVLVVSDLHLGKSGRSMRHGGPALPPYEVLETLDRLEGLVADLLPATVLCLGDNFDDDRAAHELGATEAEWLMRLQAGRRWVWVAGNHDPAPLPFPGEQVAELREAPLHFRHIATPGASAEISGHYHPKARLVVRGRAITRKCFLIDRHRVVMPPFGTYTGGLHSHDAHLDALMDEDAVAVLTGAEAHCIPMPRRNRERQTG